MTVTEGNIRYRFPAKFEALVGKLFKNSPGGSQGIFDTYVDIMVFAAAVGCAFEKRIEVDKFASKPEPIREQIFDNDAGYLLVPSLMTFYATDSIDLFDGTPQSADMRARVVEEYVCGGLSVIEERMKGEPDSNIPRILASLIKEFIDDSEVNPSRPVLPGSDILGILQSD